jgi:hypothetical protein
VTVGTTDSFTETCDEIIADALTNLGACAPGGTPQAKQRAHAFRALNRVVKSIDANGAFLWRTVRRDIAVTAGTASYPMASDVLVVDDPANFRITGQTTRTPVIGQSLEDYRRIPDRTTTGTPTQYVVDTTLSALTVILWPVPSTNGTLEVQVSLRAKDFVLGSDTPDFTQKWTACLVLGLSAAIAPAYAQDGTPFAADFLAEKERLLNDDNERVNLTLVPWGIGGYYGGDC